MRYIQSLPQLLIKLIILWVILISTAANAKVSAVIFDCDGVLVDTEYLKYQAWQTALLERGVEFDLNEYYPLVGYSSNEIANKIFLNKHLNFDLPNLIADKNRIYSELHKQEIPIFADAVQALHALINNKKARGIKVGLASSPSKNEILQNLRHIGIDENKLDAIVSGTDDLNHIQDPTGTNKPKAYIYQLIAKQLDVNPKDCLVLEDTKAGVEAAYYAGMTVLAVPNTFTKKHDFSKAKKVISFKEFDVVELEKYQAS
jgi:beta-phosphoglucomutase